MMTVFGDASFFIALLNRRDEYHERTLRLAREMKEAVVTTEAVIFEVGNYLSSPPHRERFVRWWQDVRDDRSFQLIHVDQQLFDRGMDLYARRPDKAWSLTDCISFMVMEERGIAEALTGDRHFEQAGFKALLT